MANWTNNWDRDDYERWHRYGRERGWMDRTVDEIRSWFGDEDAEKRRKMDERELSGRDLERERFGRGMYDRPEHRREQFMGQRSSMYGNDFEREHMIGRDYDRERMMGKEWSPSERTRTSQLSSSSSYGYSPSYSNPYGTGYGTSSGEIGRQREFGQHPRFFDTERSNYPNWQGQGMMGSGFSGFRGRGPKNYTRNDERIKDDIVERLSYHHEIDATDIDVQVQNGEVTLKGNVDHRLTKRLVEDIAEEVFGVREVHNQIRVNRAELFGGEHTEDKTTGRPLTSGNRR